MMLQNQKYCNKSRCPCHKNKLACTIDCDCVNCDNPHGSTRGNIVGEQRATSRKRRRSHINFLHQTGYSYLEKQKEKISQGRWKMVKRGNISFAENSHDINKKE